MEAESLSPDQVAADRGLPFAAVREAIQYCQSHSDVIEDDLRREHELLKRRGLMPSDVS